MILESMNNFESEVMNDTTQEIYTCKSYVKVHKKALASFYQRVDLKSDTICLSCLVNAPEHRLDCRQILCSDCVKDLGRITSGSTVAILDHCPLDA